MRTEEGREMMDLEPGYKGCVRGPRGEERRGEEGREGGRGVMTEAERDEKM